MSNKIIENNNINASKEFIRCLQIEHDIMLLENQIKNLTHTPQTSEIAKFEREQAKIDLATQQKLSQVENLNAKKEEMDQISKKITSLEEKRREAGFIGKMRIDGQKDRLSDRKKRVQAAVKRLETKIGKIDLSQQYQTSFNDNLAFAM
jgi:hypothetical protein